MDKKYFAGAVAKVTGSPLETLRSWCNRNGLLRAGLSRHGWRRFSVADVCAVQLVAKLTAMGLSAQRAVDAASMALPILEHRVSGTLPAYLLVSAEGGAAVQVVSADDLTELCRLFDDQAHDAIVVCLDCARLFAPVLDRLDERSPGDVAGGGRA
ncbi:MerR family transcriptional regulator [Bradyrhizobium sp. USDA 4454]